MRDDPHTATMVTDWIGELDRLATDPDSTFIEFDKLLMKHVRELIDAAKDNQRLREVAQRAGHIGCRYPSVVVGCPEPLGPGSCISCHARSVLAALNSTKAEP